MEAKEESWEGVREEGEKRGGEEREGWEGVRAVRAEERSSGRAAAVMAEWTGRPRVAARACRAVCRSAWESVGGKGVGGGGGGVGEEAWERRMREV